ncbi:MAG: CHAT domain-containing protein [Promethearchaeati archaeon SRVP18_Atabeyarchaeia-1]
MNRDDNGRMHFKIVVWGPFRSGKTAMVKWYYNNVAELSKGGFTSVENNRGETVYFDYASLSTGGEVLYDFFAVGGSESCARERRILTEGADGLIFVAESERSKMSEDVASLDELMAVMGQTYSNLPKIFMLNKRDTDGDLITVNEFGDLPGVRGSRVYESIAINGDGISQAFQVLLVDLVQRTLTIQAIPQAPPELTRLGVALIGNSGGFEPTLESTYPQVFSLSASQVNTTAGMHPSSDTLPSFATVKTEDFYLCSYHTAKRDQFGVSYIVALAMPSTTPPKRIFSLFKLIQDSAPIILGQKDVTSVDDLNQALEQFYIVARDHITSAGKRQVESLVPNPREFFKSRLFVGGTTEAISAGVGYLSVSRQKNQYEMIYAPGHISGTYSTLTPLDEYGLKTMIKDVDRLRSNMENKTRTATTEDLRKRYVKNFLDEIKKVGASIFNTLLSKSMLTNIEEDDPEYLTFEVDRDELMIPFEILHDGDKFLCLKKPISRWIIEEHGSIADEERDKVVPRVRGDSEPVTILLIDSKVEGKLSSPSSYEDQLEQFLTDSKSFGDVTVKVETLKGEVNRQAFEEHLSSGKYDIVHFVGSAESSSGDPTASSWLFIDGEVRGNELRKLFKNGYPQLIVSYVCWPPWERGWDGKQQDRILHTLAYGVKLAGPECFVGAVTEGMTESTLTLTKAFYEELIKNKRPVGEALKEARLQLIESKGMEDDNWMKPILYGNPAKRVSQISIGEYE